MPKKLKANSETERIARQQRHLQMRQTIAIQRLANLTVDWHKREDRYPLVKRISEGAVRELEKPNPDRKKVEHAKTLLNERIDDAKRAMLQWDKLGRTTGKTQIPAKEMKKVLAAIADQRLILQESIEGMRRVLRTIKEKESSG